MTRTAKHGGPARERTSTATEDQLLTISYRATPLCDGRSIRCPLCSRVADILDYVPLQHVDKYAEYLVPPLKCRGCRHVFCLRP